MTDQSGRSRSFSTGFINGGCVGMRSVTMVISSPIIEPLSVQQSFFWGYEVRFLLTQHLERGVGHGRRVAGPVLSVDAIGGDLMGMAQHRELSGNPQV